ncbi:MAG: hypothetical protein WC747_01580 [Candidatus Babeliales bacterium]|jgi:hypothetical protein
MEQKSYNQPKKILYLSISLAIVTFSGIKLYKTWQEIQTKKEVDQKRKYAHSAYEHKKQQQENKNRMDNFYLNEFKKKSENFWIATCMNPDYAPTYLREIEADEAKIENKMYQDGYSNMDIGIIKNKARQLATEVLKNFKKT